MHIGAEAAKCLGLICGIGTEFRTEFRTRWPLDFSLAAVGDPGLSAKPPKHEIKSSVLSKNVHGVKNQEHALQACPEPSLGEAKDFMNNQANNRTENQNHSEE